MRLQTMAYHRATLLVHSKRVVIETVAAELLDSRTETVEGARLYALLDATPDAEVSAETLAALPFVDLIPDEASEGFMVDEKALLRAAGLVKGDIDPGLLLSRDAMAAQAALFREQSDAWFAAQAAKDAYATHEAAPFPTKPDLRDKVVAV